MELELRADPDAVAGLARLKSLSQCRDGRPRTQAVKIVWFDNPEHALLASGLCLAEQRGGWRLERAMPGQETWLPAQPAPLVAEEPDLTTLPAPLAPLAAFEGRRTASVHQFADGAVSITIEKGLIRAVAAEKGVARIVLSGEEAAVRAAALLIAEAIPAEVPSHSLATEAIALAIGRPAKPRRHGAPILPDLPQTAHQALAHIVGHITDVIVANAPGAAAMDEAGVEAVHQMRVAVRRARSALSIFAPIIEPSALSAVSGILKSLGQKLGPTRDWDVFMTETIPLIEGALPADPRIERLAAAAARNRHECRSALVVWLDSRAFRIFCIELAVFAAAVSWHITAIDQEPMSLEAFSAQVLQHRWKKLLAAGKRMEKLDVPALHGVRLRAKRARYAAEMFATLYRCKAAHKFIKQLSKLQQNLGVLNDGAVSGHLLEELGASTGRHAFAAGVISGYMAARAETMRPRIISSFEKFRRQDAYWT